MFERLIIVSAVVVFAIAACGEPQAETANTPQTAPPEPTQQPETTNASDVAPEEHIDRAIRFVEEGEYDRAIQELDTALLLDPDNARVYFTRGRIHNVTGKYDLAIEDFDTSLRLDPENVLAYAGRGTAYNSKGEYDRAIQDYDAAVPPRTGESHSPLLQRQYLFQNG